MSKERFQQGTESPVNTLMCSNMINSITLICETYATTETLDDIVIACNRKSSVCSYGVFPICILVLSIRLEVKTTKKIIKQYSTQCFAAAGITLSRSGINFLSDQIRLTYLGVILHLSLQIIVTIKRKSLTGIEEAIFNQVINILNRRMMRPSTIKRGFPFCCSLVLPKSNTNLSLYVLVSIILQI